MWQQGVSGKLEKNFGFPVRIIRKLAKQTEHTLAPIAPGLQRVVSGNSPVTEHKALVYSAVTSLELL
jgi:hypothetical protein